MRVSSVVLLSVLLVSCRSFGLHPEDARKTLTNKGYTFPIFSDREGEAVYVHLTKRKAEEGDLSLLCNWRPIESIDFESVVFERNYFSNAEACTRLKKLSFYNCGQINTAHLMRFSTLERLATGGDNCKDKDINNISKIVSLTRLYLRHSPISPQGVKHLAGNASQIEYLDIEDTDTIDDSVFPYLLQMPHLREVSLRRTKVTDDAADRFVRAYRKRYNRKVVVYT